MNARLFARHKLALAVLAVFGIATAAHAAVADNLAAHYRLDETNGGSTAVANSAPGATENGVRKESTLIGQTGVVGTGYVFNGNTKDDYVMLGSAVPDALVGTDKMTFVGWLNPSFYRDEGSTNAASRHIFYGTSANLQLALAGNGRIFFNYVVGGSNANILAPAGTQLPKNQFSHVAITRDGSAVKIYVNGILISSVSSLSGNFSLPPYDHDSDAETPDTRAAWLGTGYLNTSSTTTARDFDGTIDDVGVWTGRALSQQQIAAIAGLGALTGRVDLASSQIDDVLAVYSAQGGSAVAGNYRWSFTDTFAPPADASALALGKHYIGSDGSRYIILGGSAGQWSGVAGTAVVPEPAALGLLGLGAVACLRRRPAR